MNGEELAGILHENLIFVVVGTCFVVGMILKALTSIIATLSREHSRREIAAYIAEGSISAEQGERLMKAEPRKL